jgi:hypothetical protein
MTCSWSVSSSTRMNRSGSAGPFLTCSTPWLYCFSVTIQMCFIVYLLYASDRLGGPLEDKYFLSTYNVNMRQVNELLHSIALNKEWKGEGDMISMTRASSLLLSSASDRDLPLTDSLGVLKMCQQQTHVTFKSAYHVVLMFWIMFMLAEMKDAVWEVIAISGIRRAGSESCITAKLLIKSLGLRTKALMTVVVGGARVVIGSLAFYCGAKYLILQQDDIKLVVKAVSMKLLIEIDDLLVKSLATVHCHQELGKARMQTDRQIQC